MTSRSKKEASFSLITKSCLSSNCLSGWPRTSYQKVTVKWWVLVYDKYIYVDVASGQRYIWQRLTFAPLRFMKLAARRIMWYATKNPHSFLGPCCMHCPRWYILLGQIYYLVKSWKLSMQEVRDIPENRSHALTWFLEDSARLERWRKHCIRRYGCR